MHRFATHWVDAPQLAAAEVSPLGGITPPCPCLSAAQQAPDRIGLPRRMALVTPGLDGLRSAVQAGLGITCRSAPGMALPTLPADLLPRLPAMTCSVIQRHSRKGETGEIAALLASALATLSCAE
ncbi:LysR family transcription regulator [Pseudogemmobacter bohemicus]|uniref:hypothetical protein n=1 Tax=Pseudogemmobacter bohemicus TaxID=2250708 RepID=UPI00130062D1|nr:hypothetical protein [Pseudogemmobacter bohemicus]